MSSEFLWELIFAMACIYPFLADSGAYFTAPMLIRVNEVDISNLSSVFRYWVGTEIYSLETAPNKFEKLLSSATNDNLLVCRYTGGRYVSENLKTLASFCEEQMFSGEENTLIMVISGRPVSRTHRECFAGEIRPGPLSSEKIHFYKGLQTRMCNLVVSEQSWLLQKLEGIAHEAVTPDRAVFECVVECLRLALEHSPNDDDLKSAVTQLDEDLSQIEDEWESGLDPEFCLRFLWQSLWDQCVDAKLKAISRWHIFTDSELASLDSVILFDDKHYCLSESLLSEICDGNADSISAEELKEGLADAGVLVTEGDARIYYSKHLSLRTADGSTVKPRFLKLKRDAIDSIGDRGLLDLLSMRGGVVIGD